MEKKLCTSKEWQKRDRMYKDMWWKVSLDIDYDHKYDKEALKKAIPDYKKKNTNASLKQFPKKAKIMKSCEWPDQWELWLNPDSPYAASDRWSFKKKY